MSLIEFSNEVKQQKVATPQRQATPGKVEVVNNAGGFVFKVSDKDRLERFLILGTEGGTYYVNQKTLTKQNTAFVANLLKTDWRLVVDTAVDVSVNGRAYRNSPAIFTLALALCTEGVDKTYVVSVVNSVVRTSTHLFEFVQYLDDLGGWGRAKRTAVSNWYLDKSANQLAYQFVKYSQRNGWTHRDVIRLAHPKGLDKSLGAFALGKDIVRTADTPPILAGFAEMQRAKDSKTVVSILSAHKNLPWETIPTNHLKSVDVWKTLFYNGQLSGQALVRSITRLARIGVFNDLSFAADVAAALTDEEMIERTRLHPVNYLNAAVVHKEGQVDRKATYYSMCRSKDWNTSSVILDALNDGFHLAFKSVVPAGKRTMLALDVSGSMSARALGIDLSCAQVAGAVAMTIARTEPAHIIRGFTSSLTDLDITAKTSLAVAMRNVQKSNFGSTDCAQPMLWALRNKMEIDTFVVLTDSETWAGRVKPFQALKKYRDMTGIPARLAVFGVSATDFTIADPSDRGMMDFVGFDSNAPKVLADFSAGRL